MEFQKKKRGELDQEEEDAGGREIFVLVEDLFHEILLRVSPSSLLSCLSVSRSWYRLCSSSLFRLSYQSRHRDSLLGLFLNIPCHSSIFLPTAVAVPVAAPGHVKILDSRGGWLLVQNLVSSSLSIFHPVFNKNLNIISPKLNIPTSSFHVLLPDPFSSDVLRHFRILRVVANYSSHLLLEIFSSESPGNWKRIRSSSGIHAHRCFSEPHPVLVNGFIHWFNGEHQILALDEKSYDLSIVGLPRELPLYLTTHRCLGKIDGRLCYAYVEASCLYVWVLVDRCYYMWSLEHRIQLGEFEELSLPHVRPIAFVGGSFPLVILVSEKKIFSFDLASRELWELCNGGFEVDHVFPYKKLESDYSNSAMCSIEELL